MIAAGTYVESRMAGCAKLVDDAPRMNLRPVRLRPCALRLALVILMGVPLRAEQTADGDDVAALLKRARTGEVAAQLKLATHVLDRVDRPADDDAPEPVPVDWKELERWLVAAAAKGDADAAMHLGSIYFEGLGGERNLTKAFAAFTKAAGAGRVSAMLTLADFHLKGHGVPVDFAKAEEWLRRAQAKAGGDNGLAEVATARLQELAESRERAAEIAALRRRADAGDAAAAAKLHEYLGSREDPLFYSPDEAMRYLRRAAELGEKYAQDELARQLLADHPDEALAWRRKAAEQGVASAQYDLAIDFGEGRGTTVDRAEAARWLMLAAAQGMPLAQQTLAKFPFYAGFSRSTAEALLAQPDGVARLTAAAEKGASEAQFVLGNSGRLPKRADAVAWLAKAAGQEHRAAMTALAAALNNGDGVPRDVAQSRAWYARAAQLGDTEAMLRLGEALLDGHGVAADPALAKFWLQRGASLVPGSHPQRAWMEGTAAKITAPPTSPDRSIEQLQALAALAGAPGTKPATPVAVASAPTVRAAPAAPPTEPLSAAAAKGDAAANDPFKSNPILQQAALATKALKGDAAAAAELDAQQRQLKAQRDLVNGAPPVPAPSAELEQLHRAARDAFLNDRRPDAIKLWEQAAARGHVGSALALSEIFLGGARGILADPAKGRQWLEKAAATGDATAVERLRQLEKEMAGGRWEYELGQLAAEDEEGPQAVALFERSAALGETRAMLALGRLYRGGSGVTPDEGKVRAWFQRSADAGSAEGMVNLAFCHRDGVGGAPDLALARKWFEQAARVATDPADAKQAAAGLESIAGKTADSANTLGLSALAGKDYAKALEWFRKGSDLGSPLATYNVADMYANGSGVKADPAEALRWFEKAAAQGNKLAVGRARELRGALNLPPDPALGDGPRSVTDALLALVSTPAPPPAPPSPALPPAQQALLAKAEAPGATAQDWLALGLALCPPPAANPQRVGLKQAFPWFLRAAEAGLEQAQFFVFQAYRDGLPGTPADEAAAAKWLERLAGTAGPRPVRLQFAQALEAGLLGLRRDRDRAGQLYAQLAAEKFGPGAKEWERFQRETAVNPRPAPAGETPASRRAAAIAGDADAAVRQHLATGYEVGRDLATDEALDKALIAGASGGNLAARTVLAWIWIDNRIGDEEVPGQIAQLRAAAEAGVNEARYRYGLCLWDGIDSIDEPGRKLLARDRKAAVQWFADAALRGHPQAHEALGRAYAQGEGVARNEAQARRHLRAAAALGVVGAHVQVAQSALREGEGLRARIAREGREPDADEKPWIDALASEAVRHLEAGAKAAEPEAMVALARLLEEGRTAPADRPRALGLLLAAAKSGSAAALSELAGAYASGDRYGVKRDLAMSRDHLAQLAAQGDAGAARRIGDLFMGADGHPRDPALAYQNFALAVDLGAGAEVVRARDAAAKLLTASARAVADGRVVHLRSMLLVKGVRLVEPRPAPAPASAAPPAPSVPAPAAAPVDPIRPLRAKAAQLQGLLVRVGKRVYRVPPQVPVVTMDSKVTLTTMLAQYTFSEKDNAYQFGARPGSTMDIQVADLVRRIESTGDIRIVTLLGPCKACAAERGTWVNNGRPPASCNHCGSTGCAPQMVLIDGKSQPF